jgi:hypothetical protein
MLSQETINRLGIALTSDAAALELIALIEAGGNPVAALVANFGATTNLPASNAALSTSDTYTDAAVKAAIDGAVDAKGAAAETRLDNIETKLNAILTALKNAGLMASA